MIKNIVDAHSGALHNDLVTFHAVHGQHLLEQGAYGAFAHAHKAHQSNIAVYQCFGLHLFAHFGNAFKNIQHFVFVLVSGSQSAQGFLLALFLIGLQNGHTGGFFVINDLIHAVHTAL